MPTPPTFEKLSGGCSALMSATNCVTAAAEAASPATRGATAMTLRMSATRKGTTEKGSTL